MNQKLHNTLPALTVSAALLVAGLLVVSPVSPPDQIGATSTSDIVALAVLANPMEDAAGIGTDSDPGADTPGATSRSGHYRQRFLAMPYFSFVPRG